MIISRTTIYTKIKGSWGENEDWWTLFVDSKLDTKMVEHKWSYVKLSSLKSNNGLTVMTIDKFFASNADEKAKSELRQLLKE